MSDNIDDSVTIDILNYLRVCNCDFRPEITHEVWGWKCRQNNKHVCVNNTPEIFEGSCSVCFNLCNIVCNCGHIYCEECIRKNKSITPGKSVLCPICREEIKTIRRFSISDGKILLSDYKIVDNPANVDQNTGNPVNNRQSANPPRFCGGFPSKIIGTITFIMFLPVVLFCIFCCNNCAPCRSAGCWPESFE